jgi:hypothetical protein
MCELGTIGPILEAKESNRSDGINVSSLSHSGETWDIFPSNRTRRLGKPPFSVEFLLQARMRLRSSCEVSWGVFCTAKTLRVRIWHRLNHCARVGWQERTSNTVIMSKFFFMK